MVMMPHCQCGRCQFKSGRGRHKFRKEYMESFDEFWSNLIYTFNAPDTKKGWALRGHYKTEKTKAWFQMILLSEGCETKEEAKEKGIAMAIELAKVGMSEEVLEKFED